MGGWRRKIIVLLVFYFAGFATAIYFLAPAPELKAQAKEKSSIVHSAFKSDEFARSFNKGLHKCLDYAKDAADYAGDYVHKKLKENKSDS